MVTGSTDVLTKYQQYTLSFSSDGSKVEISYKHMIGRIFHKISCRGCFCLGCVISVANRTFIQFILVGDMILEIHF